MTAVPRLTSLIVRAFDVIAATSLFVSLFYLYNILRTGVSSFGFPNPEGLLEVTSVVFLGVLTLCSLRLSLKSVLGSSQFVKSTGPKFLACAAIFSLTAAAAGEGWIQIDELRLRAEVNRLKSAGNVVDIARDRAWPNETATIGYNETLGFWGED